MKLAELVIEMSANTARIRKDFDQALGMAEHFAAAVKAAVGGLAVGFSLAGISEAIKDVADFGAEIARAAQKTGMSAAQISGLKFAAQSAGVGFEQLQRGLAIFDKNVAGLSNTNTKANQALQALGLSAKDAQGNIKPAYDLFLEVAEKFKTMPDGVEKAALAMTLFGRAGATLIPLLDQGAMGIKALTDEAQRLGVVMSDEDAKAALNMEHALDELGAAWTGMKNAAVLALGPWIIDALHAMAHPLEEVTKLALQFAISIAEAFRAVSDLIAGLPFAVAEPFKDVSDRFTDFIEDTKAQIRDLREEMNKSVTPEFKPTKGVALPSVIAPGTTGATAAPKLGLESYDKALEQWIKEMERADKQPPTLKRTLEDLNEAFARGIIGIKEYTRFLAELREQGIHALPELKIPTTAPPMPDFMKQQLPSYSAAHTAMLQLKSDAHTLGSEMSGSFEKMLLYSRNFSQSLRGLLNIFLEFLMKQYLFKELANLFKSLSGGGGTSGGFFGVLSSFFGGMTGKQVGGPVSQGQLYMVGESGPELFMPGTNGSIVPNKVFAGRGGDTYIDARGADAGVEIKVIRALTRQQAQMRGQMLVAVNDARRRGVNI